jgi:hypothetical protein
MAFDAGLRSRLGAEATKVNERFSPEVIYSRWLSLIDGVARRGSGKQDDGDPAHSVAGPDGTGSDQRGEPRR